MNAFRALLVVIFLAVVIYTVPVIQNHGMNLFEVFFGDMGEMGWPGQFNLDFTGFLILSGTWVMWRHHFRPAGIALGIGAFFLGAPYLSAYLLFHSFQVNGDVAALLLGPERAKASSGA